MPPHRLTNFETQKYYQNEARFIGVYSRDNLHNKIKDETYVIKLDKYVDVGTHWIDLYVKNYEIIYFDGFGVENVLKAIENLLDIKAIKTDIFRIQSHNSIVCGYFCIGFIDFMFAGKTLIDFTSLFSPYDFEENGSIILEYFKGE